MKVIKIEHIGFATKDLNEAKKLYSSLGMNVSENEELNDVRVAFVECGESSIELLESTISADDTSRIEASPRLRHIAISKFIAEKGPGIHHIAFQVDDLDAALSIMKEKGMRLIDEVAQIGAGGHKVAFIHPDSTDGVLIELCQH